MSSKIKNSLNKMWSWMTSSSNPITRLWNDYTGNTSIDKQLAHQQAENEATREYNLQLAEKQNNWNIQQWQRENEYNTPSAQKARLEAAGLNPDLMYGAGGVMNTSASSPQMTAGAPASPTDWTALGAKRSLLESLSQTAQIEQIQALTDKIKSETKGQDISNNIQSWEQEIIDVMREEGYQGSIAYGRAAYEEYKGRIEHLKFDTESEKFSFLIDELQHDKTIRQFERELIPKQREMFESLVRDAVASANIKVFLDEMKALDFWTDKGIQAAQTVLGAIGAVGKFRLPPSELIEVALPNGNAKSIYKRYEK